jgi:hypothetical protein
MTNTNGTVYFDGTRLVTAAPSTAGFVLTSNGASAPTFQAASGGSGITQINGNSGSVNGSTVTLTTGASNVQGTAKFTGAIATMTLAFSDTLDNLGIGRAALSGSLSSASDNVCLGSTSGQSLTTGANNCCIGFGSGVSMVSSNNNTFVGRLSGNAATASGNTAVGSASLLLLSSGSGNNTAVGFGALTALLTGTNCIALGNGAGQAYTGSESNNISIGNVGTAGESNKLRIGGATGTGANQLNAAFVCGIQGITVTGTAVLISSSDQLGIAVSSQRFKNDIQTMTTESEAIYKLRPVTFVINRDSAPGLADAPTSRQCGLIAEEVAQVLPQYVSLDKDGMPLSVSYGDLTSLLINEVQKLRDESRQLNTRITALETK